jgi:hypothetical protein
MSGNRFAQFAPAHQSNRFAQFARPAMTDEQRAAQAMTMQERVASALDRGAPMDPEAQAAIDTAVAENIGLTDAPSGAMQGFANTALGIGRQFGVGTQEGIASMAGFPVDAVTNLINAGGGAIAGESFQPIQRPFMGSESIAGMLEPVRRGVPDPQTRSERFARRIGEEAGAGAVMLPAAMATVPGAMARPGALASAEMASAVGAGAGAAAANEIAPGSAMAEITGALLGGVPTGVLSSRLAGLGGEDALIRPGIEDQRAWANELYGEVRADQRVLPQESVEGLVGSLGSRMDAERINPRLQPGSAAILDAISADAARPTRIEDVENLRRLTTRALPATASPDDRRLSQIMQGQISDYLESLGDPVADKLPEARAAYRRASAAGDVASATDRAALRAATSGTGGNEINAVRQNLRRILDTPRLSRSFTQDELGAIREIVEGTASQNTMRRLSRIAPSTGGLSAMLGIGGVMADPMIALPVIAGAEGMRAVGERSTQASIARLLQSLAPDRVMRPSDPGVDAIARALMGIRTATLGSRGGANDE